MRMEDPVETTSRNANKPGDDALRERFQGALEQLRPGFQADGMDLAIGSVGGSAVEVRVLMGPNACEECLLPPATLQEFFLATIRQVDAAVERVEVVIDRSATSGEGQKP